MTEPIPAERRDDDVPVVEGEATDPVFGEVVTGDGGEIERAARREEGAANGGWGRVLRGNRTLWIVAGASAVALVAGLVLGRFVISPLDAAAGAGAPEPGLVTVPVEYGELSNDVTLRGDVGYADAVELKLDTTSFEGAAIVTGQVPEVGAELSALSIALEVTGRPVIVLPGELPAYRTLTFGVSGPDVQQLKAALAEVGIEPGDRESDVFDEAAANAVGELYRQAGYPAPTATEGPDAVRAAEDGVRGAEQALADAQKALNEAAAGPSDIERRQADNEIASLHRQIAAVESEGADASDLRDQLAIAEMQRQALDAPRDTSAEQSLVDGAAAQVAAANEELVSARQGALPYLPASEVLFLAELPRRVDSVEVERGSSLEAAAMTVSGASVRLTGSAANADVELLEVGDEVFFELPDGEDHRAVISDIAEGDDGARSTLQFEPDPLTPEQMEAVQGTNVRIQIPVGATDGEVLSVPYAALTAGPGGESRVEVVTGDPRDGDRAETRLVVVETGLAAGGYVEVAPVDDELAEGDLVVVGS
ncbi:hypothetical protein N8K70_11295 [Microbacterium betulae]|uniref:Peptidoglycan binding-like domain-containing protein n=1 Tax=Microbacterium betulae TaxID=2981139 RepID=A0AA97FGB6_9MICO|nr:hypothetical protein [Microbacterium sp. AB]WOF21964.1 hypothetical protein N8K70_11295 [Microbacterium sp. AB]